MTQLALFLIQYGLAFVFVWTGILILRNVDGWADMLQDSWAREYLPASPRAVMMVVAWFDLLVGVWLALGVWLWIPALAAALHLLQVLLVKGIMGPTYRDVGLLLMALALFVSVAPFFS
jgi:hypothetical protein